MRGQATTRVSARRRGRACGGAGSDRPQGSGQALRSVPPLTSRRDAARSGRRSGGRPWAPPIGVRRQLRGARKSRGTLSAMRLDMLAALHRWRVLPVVFLSAMPWFSTFGPAASRRSPRRKISADQGRKEDGRRDDAHQQVGPAQARPGRGRIRSAGRSRRVGAALCAAAMPGPRGSGRLRDDHRTADPPGR